MYHKVHKLRATVPLIPNNKSHFRVPRSGRALAVACSLRSWLRFATILQSCMTCEHLEFAWLSRSWIRPGFGRRHWRKHQQRVLQALISGLQLPHIQNSSLSTRRTKRCSCPTLLQKVGASIARNELQSAASVVLLPQPALVQTLRRSSVDTTHYTHYSTPKIAQCLISVIEVGKEKLDASAVPLPNCLACSRNHSRTTFILQAR